MIENKKCFECNGTGHIPYDFLCYNCGSNGFIKNHKTNTYTCVRCLCTGDVPSEQCPCCSGKGYRDWIDKIRRPYEG